MKEKKDISDILKENFINYSLAVITERAIPDIRDGLKPVQRKILFAISKMREGFIKVAKISGVVAAEYHPHGTASIDDAIIRLNQNFSLNLPLLEPQGNFGSKEGDEAAAPRYIESRLGKLKKFMLEGMNENGSHFVKNYDGTEEEPELLPFKFNNLLINGCTGISSGFSVDIPLHNINEVCDATIACAKSKMNNTPFNPLDYIKGPDFPTDGTIDVSDIKDIYGKGKGSFKIRAEIEEDNKTLLIKSLPYTIKVENIINEIKNNEKISSMLSNIRNEGHSGNIRIRLFMKDNNAELLKNILYKETSLQYFCKVNFVIIKNKKLIFGGITRLLEEFVIFRFNTLVRIFKFRLNKLEREKEIIEGIIYAIDKNNIERIIKTIKESKNKEEAKTNLIAKFKFSSLQVDKILEITLSKLTSLEKEKLENDYKNIKKQLEDIKKTLSSRNNIYNIIIEEQETIKNTFGVKRRTKIKKIVEFEKEEVIENKSFYLVYTSKGYLKKLDENSYEKQKKGGKGRNVGKMYENDIVINFKKVENHDVILAITNTGKILKSRTWEIKETKIENYGIHASNIFKLKDEKIVSLLFISKKDFENKDNSLIFLTKKGLIKEVNITEFKNISSNGIIATKIKDDDTITEIKFFVKDLYKKPYIVITTSLGKNLYFNKKEIKPVKRTTYGIRGIKLTKNEESVSLNLVESNDDYLLIISEKGKGKKTPIKAYPIKKRANVGLKSLDIESNDRVVATELVKEEDNVAICTKSKVIVINVKNINFHKGRITKGFRLIKLNENDKVILMKKL